jgi:ubiquinone/menaquinone biosynthesis C-methylase UbiE
MRFKQIVRFNWPYYAVAGLCLAAGPAIVHAMPLPPWLRYSAYAGLGLVAMWLAASLVVSWIVYDRSRLMDWDWVLQALGFSPKSWINLHAGHDDSSAALKQIFPAADGRVFDIFDQQEMSEPSIARARRLGANAIDAERADYRHLPLARGSVDVAMLLLSAHELRSEDARSALFTELRRVLGPAGRVVVAEHLRDWTNFLAYGPGVLHFHSRRTWLRCFSRHRFDVHREFSITPFVRVFVLRRLT